MEKERFIAVLLLLLLLQLSETLQHLVRGRNRLAVDFVGALGLDHVDELLNHVHVGRFDIALRQRAGTNGSGVLMQGYVESSNVNVVEEMVNMIQTQRAYEINSKAITTSDQMLQKLAQL